MAREYKQVDVPARTEKRLARITCDICGREGKDDDWEARGYDVCEVEVRHKQGVNYPDSGDGDEIDLDVCPECFREKLVPFIESFGRVKIKPKEWSW
jgi:hypothetical protein